MSDPKFVPNWPAAQQKSIGDTGIELVGFSTGILLDGHMIAVIAPNKEALDYITRRLLGEELVNGIPTTAILRRSKIAPSAKKLEEVK